MTIVREATSGDIPRLIELARMAQAESAPMFPEVDPDKTAESIGMVLGTPIFVLFVAESGDHLIGYLVAGIVEFFHSREKSATVDLLYVAPKHRGSSAARRLIAAYEDWADAHGAWEKRLGNHTGINMDRTAAFYQRLGYEPHGYTYRRRANVRG